MELFDKPKFGYLWWKGDDRFKVLVASLNDVAAIKTVSNGPVDQADLAMIKKAKQLPRRHKTKS